MHKVLLLLRIALGWLFFYSGITKVLDVSWTAVGYLNSAHTFGGFYHWLASPGLIGSINLVNSWGQLLLGIALILGIWVRPFAFLGGILMLLYYLPVLDFPHVSQHYYLVDEHIIFALILFYFAAGGNRNLWSLFKG